MTLALNVITPKLIFKLGEKYIGSKVSNLELNIPGNWLISAGKVMTQENKLLAIYNVKSCNLVNTRSM
jgi:hypothetical protein